MPVAVATGSGPGRLRGVRVRGGSARERCDPPNAARGRGAIVAFLFIRFGVAVELRPRYLPQQERTYPVVGTGGPNRLAGDWIIGGGGPGVGAVFAADGTRIKGGQMVCGPDLADECRDEVGPGAYNFEVIQPAGRFWTFQGVETSLFLALAFAAFAVTVVWVRRRLA